MKQFYTELSYHLIKCNECGVELSGISDLKKHLRNAHKINPASHMCQDCGNKYASIMLVRQHQVEKHGDVGEFTCELCHKQFVEKCLLRSHHKSAHSDEKPKVCDICGQAFKKKPHLDRHKTTHTGERNFSCRYCDAAFATDWTRTQHERRHLGIQPCKCNGCKLEFSQKTSLDCHLKSHSSHRDMKSIVFVTHNQRVATKVLKIFFLLSLLSEKKYEFVLSN